MTPEQIEAKRSAIQAAIALVEGMSQHWMEERWKAANDLCDLALQSLSQEAVRNEALTAAAKICELFAPKIVETNSASELIASTAHQIREKILALKREPNAAARQSDLAQTEIKGHMRVEDELRADLVKAQKYWTLYFDECIEADVRLTEAQARIAELEKDAARYRWLRRKQAIDSELFIGHYGSSIARLTEHYADAAIDAALKSRA